NRMETIMLDRTNGHEPVPVAWDSRMLALERGLAAVAEGGERRTEILRTAIGDFIVDELSKRDNEITSLRKCISDLERKRNEQTAVDRRVAEVAARLEERAARRDEGRRGPAGARGAKGDRGERGVPGKDGVTKTVRQFVGVQKWEIDAPNFTARAVLT